MACFPLHTWQHYCVTSVRLCVCLCVDTIRVRTVFGGSGCAEETGGVRAGHTAWVRMKKRRRKREEEQSHSPPAATNMHFKDGFWRHRAASAVVVAR